MVEESGQAADATAADEPATRERSRIGFPYNDLEDGIAVAEAVWDHVGAGSAEVVQLGPWLKHDSVTSGAFRLKIAAARMFGLIETGQSNVKLTKLGRQIVDPATAAGARVNAFLTVPLYARLYKDYSGGLLPNNVGLEREIADLGVPAKQTDRARQVFQRSAETAGFFAEGNNKLVKPGIAIHDDSGGKPDRKNYSDGGGGNGDRKGSLHPFVQGLVDTLPAPGTEWSDPERRQWLTAAEAIFRLIFKDGERES